MKNLVNKFQDYNPSKEDLSKIENLADNYLDKSDDELFVEIININNTMEEQLTEEQYQSIFEKLKSIRPILSEEQRNKLDRVLDMLEKDNK